MPLINLNELLGRIRSKIGTPELKLPTSVVDHDSLDQMEFNLFKMDSPRFKRICVEDAPVIVPEVEDPPAPDFTTATPEELREWQSQARAAKEARENAPPYTNWEKLTRDMFYSYHTRRMPDVLNGAVDPSVELHRRILEPMIATDDHAHARHVTRGDAAMAAIAAMRATSVLEELLSDELAEQARESEQYTQQAQQAAEQTNKLEGMRSLAKDYHEQGEPVPPELVENIRQAVRAKRAAQGAAHDAAANATPMDHAAVEAIKAAAKAGREAAEHVANLPAFGSGLGEGEPVYESPEQALTIAEMWANNPKLRAMAALYGRFDKHMRALRAKREVGGQDEIVDVKFGDDLTRVLPAELALLGDEDFEDDFLARYASQELLVFSTVGETRSNMGPILVVLDGSGTMKGQRNIWARAVAMCLLHIARLEKRDFAAIEFSGGKQVEQWVFPARKALDPNLIVQMASHFFGGGTVPVIGVTAADELMRNAGEFKKADLVLIGDGDAPFGAEDKRLRDQLTERGVRIFGIGIGDAAPFPYLSEYAEHVVDVADFDLEDPSAATAELATHIT